MDDNWEIANSGGTGVSSGTGDQDGDHFNDLSEFLAGTSPTNDNSLLILSSPVQAGSTQMVFTWAGVVGKTYQLISSTNLLQPVWETNIPGIPGVSPITTVTNSTSGRDRYYRIKLE